MQDTHSSRIPQSPRAILGKQIWPIFFSVEFSPAERAAERLIHETEVAALRPPWHRALAAALAALGGVS